MPPAKPLREVLAAGFKDARLRQGWRQEDAAARAQSVGLASWIRGTVAQAEVGKRRFALEEVLLLALAYETSLVDLIAGDDTEVIEVTPEARLSVGTVRALLSGQSPRDLAPSVDVSPTPESARFPHPLAGADRFGIGKRDLLTRPSGASEAERHAARKLGIAPELIAEIATRLWGRTLDDERDYRLADRSPGLSPRSKQALRGHITRDLLAELGRELGGQDGT